MLVSTKAIVLGTIKYGDSSLVAKMFLPEHGLVSFMIQGVYRKRSRSPASLLQPCSIIESVCYIRENKGLHRINEMKAAFPLPNIRSQVVKSCMVLFSAEILQWVLRPMEADPALYFWLEKEIVLLDDKETVSPEWPHRFLLSLSRQLGFAPYYHGEGKYFNMKAGVFEQEKNLGRLSMSLEESLLLKHLLREDYTRNSTRELRNNLLDQLVLYVRLHTGLQQNLKSLEILREVFHTSS